MPAAQLNLTIEQGATYRRKLSVSSGTPAAPLNLTGYTIRMQVRPNVRSADVLIALNNSNGRITVNAAAGEFTLALSAAETAALSFNDGVYDIELQSPSGDVIRLAQGLVKVSPEVTRD